MFLLLFHMLWASPSEMFLRMNIPQLAREQAEKQLQIDPDRSDTHASLAIALCRLGRYHDALPHFSFVNERGQTTRLEEYHADALRAFGRIEEAVALRVEILSDKDTLFGARPRILAGIVDDYRSIGDGYHAMKSAERLLSEHPNAALSYAMMAEVYLDQGDLDEAYFYIWRGRYKKELIRTEQVFARWLLLRGLAVGAEQYLKARFENHVTNHALALYAEIKLNAYGPQKALALLDRNKFQINQSMPVLLIRYRSYRQMGNDEKMNQTAQVLRRLYGLHPLLEQSMAD